MPTFPLQVGDAEWAPQAPVVITGLLDLAAPPARVFRVLADLPGWSTWYRGMRKVRIDGAPSGVGALRTVWVGATRVQERFLVWEPGQRMTFAIIGANVPGLAVMVEDWVLAPDPATGGTRLTTTIGVEGRLLLRPFPKLLRAAIARSTRGSAGLVERFA